MKLRERETLIDQCKASIGLPNDHENQLLAMIGKIVGTIEHGPNSGNDLDMRISKIGKGSTKKSHQP